MDLSTVLKSQSATGTSRQTKAPDNKMTDEIKSQRDSDIRKTAKEMESLFAFQLIKVMRETANSMSSEKKGFGSDTYMSLFDMEVSKLFAERGLGLQDALVQWMSRVEGQEVLDNEKSEK